MRGRDLLSISDLSPDELDMLLRTALSMKRDGTPQALAGKTVAMLFEKPSLRTRVSFEVGMKQLGGSAIYLSQAEVGLGQREPVKDVARVLSRYVSGIVARTYAQQTLFELAEAADVPVVNALSDDEHPCQALADLLTIVEKKGRLDGVRLAFIGDGNNVAASLAVALALAGANFAIASPDGYALPEGIVTTAQGWAHKSGGSIELVTAPEDAVRNADVVYTDVWTSMGQEAAYRARTEAFQEYRVDAALMSLARPDAIFMHDLPAHRGEEVMDDVIEGAQSVVFDQAENRLHAQKALLAAIMAGEAIP
ncbi:MAG TPA: ornithine carbamoyltransferase [Dehalococcoidia bacterium]|nr:ornithine carbamoyltransferase [Dehalococcoidia bacterium]